VSNETYPFCPRCVGERHEQHKCPKNYKDATNPTVGGETMSNEWRSIDSAPFQEVIEVRNPQMRRPVLATRGYAAPDGMVHPDNTYCTTVFTPHPHFPFPAGRLCCPTEWRCAAITKQPEARND